jgi:hypothetical protein
MAIDKERTDKHKAEDAKRASRAAAKNGKREAAKETPKEAHGGSKKKI